MTYAVAKNPNQLADKLKLKVELVQDMLMALYQSGVIIIVEPRGAESGHVNKAKKYLFATPSIRVALAHSLGSNFARDSNVWRKFRGDLLEDTVASQLKRLFMDHGLGGSVEYDPQDGGADFIVKVGIRRDAIVIEVGANKDNTRQVTKTLNQGGRYGLIFNADIAKRTPNAYYTINNEKILSVTAAIFLLL